ncbi:MAG: hypothetical protein CM15mP64_7170 [Candidatus Neomarinimicrobiota bacterium]|nr:MAG: hypothetical protein CM15mP64_7170 [Candidatus Neomarinimicrobiota bacterium]
MQPGDTRGAIPFFVISDIKDRAGNAITNITHLQMEFSVTFDSIDPPFNPESLLNQTMISVVRGEKSG